MYWRPRLKQTLRLPIWTYFLVLVFTLTQLFAGWPQIFNFPPKIQPVHAAEISYLITTTGSSCGLGADEEILGAQGSSNSTKVLTTTGHSWNKTETERSIASGDWTVYIDITHNGSGGSKAISVLLRRMNSSCEAQETILSGSVSPTKGGTGELSITASGVGQINFAADDILLLELDPATSSVSTLYYNGSGGSYDSRMSSPDESAFALGVTGPTDVELVSIQPSQTGETTFGGGEEIIITDGGGGWSLTVEVTTTLEDISANIIPDANVYIRKDGNVDGTPGPDVYTIWSQITTNISEIDEIVSLDQSRAVGVRSSGTGDDITHVRPTIRIVADLDQTPGDYAGVLTFTVI